MSVLSFVVNKDVYIRL